MDEVTDAEVYKYQSEVTVELFGTDNEGEFAIVSYNFDRKDETTVKPRGEIEPSHLSDVENALVKSGYTLEYPLHQHPSETVSKG